MWRWQLCLTRFRKYTNIMRDLQRHLSMVNCIVNISLCQKNPLWKFMEHWKNPIYNRSLRRWFFHRIAVIHYILWGTLGSHHFLENAHCELGKFWGRCSDTMIMTTKMITNNSINNNIMYIFRHRNAVFWCCCVISGCSYAAVVCWSLHSILSSGGWCCLWYFHLISVATKDKPTKSAMHRLSM